MCLVLIHASAPAGATEWLIPRKMGVPPQPPHFMHGLGISFISRYAPFLSRVYEKTSSSFSGNIHPLPSGHHLHTPVPPGQSGHSTLVMRHVHRDRAAPMVSGLAALGGD